MSAAMGLAAALAACDAGPFRKDPASQPGEPLAVVEANVGTNRPMPVDGVVQLAFNRYILPQSVLRQSLGIVSVSGQPVSPPLVTYDPVARTVTLSSPNPPGQPWLLEGQSYRVELGVPKEGEELGGLRALDRATLAEPKSITFLVGPATGKGAAEPKVAFCTDVLPVFVAKCGDPSCHGGTVSPKVPENAAGLLLTTSAGMRATALNRAAQGANTGGLGKPSPAVVGGVFGVNMPLVDPTNPGNSWLMYKLLLAPPPRVPPSPAVVMPVCKNRGSTLAGDYTPLAKTSEAPDEREQQVLQDNVLGRPMPFPVPAPVTYAEIGLTFAEREKVRLWIAQGAEVPECGGCTAVDAVTDAGAPAEAGPSPSDGGAPDSSSDAGAD